MNITDSNMTQIDSNWSIITLINDERLIIGWIKDCDSGVHTVVNLANSFNTDVGYSSETSRAASHPSSVAFKRRSFTNKSASQNYSSPTESLGSQTGHGDAIGCSQSPSPSPMDAFGRPVRAADPRRLSYKRFFFFNCLVIKNIFWNYILLRVCGSYFFIIS